MSATFLDACALRAELVAGRRSVVSTVEQALRSAQAAQGTLNAFLEIDAAGALERARELDRQHAAGAVPGKLFGLPIAFKSNMCWRGRETNCGSRILAGWRAPYDATFVERAVAAGAVPLGMTNMDEFAMGSSGENSAFGPTRNPWDLERTPGGSSSGSAAVVAAGIAPLALGSDTGGSVRQPAALSGICGFKPTYGRISRYGLVAFASSLDQVSPFARSVRDLELVLAAISGADERDSTALPLPALEPAAPRARLDGLRIGVPAEYFPKDLDSSVNRAVRAALAELEQLGARLVPVSLAHSQYAIATYYVVATAEASSNLARFDGVRYGPRREGSGSLNSMYAATREAGFGDEVKRRILLGTYVLSSGYYDAWYRRALKVRRLLLRDFEQAFEQVDLIAGPTSPSAAFRLGEKASDPVAMYLSDVLTVPASLAGLPALSVPCGFKTDGAQRLPIGLQFIGPSLADAALLGVARCYQEHSTHHQETSPYSARLALAEVMR